MTAEPSPPQRRRELLAQITKIGHVLPGSLNTVMNRCGKPRCACHGDPPRLHGPYITWTRKVAGAHDGGFLPTVDDKNSPG